MSSARIMVVEDEGIVALDIRNKLRRMGYSVTGIADSGEDAVIMALDTKPDLVLMDIRLKGEMDGIEAARQIRKQYSIPVVYLTAYADTTTRRRADATGPAAYLLKPFDDIELHGVIQQVLVEVGPESSSTNGGASEQQPPLLQ
ncbi:MAG: response regulator [Anaerolineae bacterium]|nr:response regulator [Anaerolineae bacterium]